MLSGKSGLLDTVEKCVKVTQVCLSDYLCRLVCLCMIESVRMCLLYRVLRGCLSIEVSGRTVRIFGKCS